MTLKKKEKNKERTVVPIWSTQYVRTAKAAGPHRKTLLPYYKFIIPATRRKRQENQASLSYLRLSVKKPKSFH